MVKICIAGFGFVGQAVYASLQPGKVAPIYDRYKPQFSDISKLTDSELIFCCVPTPMDKTTGEQDFSEVEFLLRHLQHEKYQGIVVVKSTVLPGNIAPWAGKLKIVVNPEFLNQNSAADDFRNQPVVILGGEAIDCHRVEQLYGNFFRLADPSYQYMSVAEACWFKYLHNVYHAYQVLFWNFAHDLTGNSRKYTALYEKLYGRKPILSQVCADGLPGYGGACFPKDVNALWNEYNHPLTIFMRTYNRMLRPAVEPQNG